MTNRYASGILMGVSMFALARTSSANAQAIPPAAADAPAPVSTAASPGLQGPARPANLEPAVGEIIVTAQKRAESINNVGMSIAAVSGAQLATRGIVNAADLVKSVPGFTYNETALGTPVYTLRGVGFEDQSLSAGPTVSIYVDEVPLPFAFMTKGSIFDLERIEVLKGPQGTLYGQNSTGGAFNYIAAKATNTFAAGVNAEYGRFNTLDATGYVSGPLTSTIKARLAFRTILGDDWQKSYTRNDTLGRQRQYQARALLDWSPSDRFTANFNFTAWKDRSDTVAPQVAKIDPQVPSGVRDFIANYPLAPADPRAADWDPGADYARNDWFIMGSARLTYKLTDDIQIISITAGQKFKTDAFYDNDGYSYRTGDRQGNGTVKTFNQELRLAGETGRLKWIVGGNYSDYKVSQFFTYYLPDASNSHNIFANLGALGPNGEFGFIGPEGVSFATAGGYSRNRIKSYAGFANAEWEILPRLTVIGGVRYTQTNRNAYSCAIQTDQPDPSGSNLSVATQQLYANLGLKTTPLVPTTTGDCTTLDQNFNPGPYIARLRENNVSWRAGLNWKTPGNILLYGNVSRGYKAGSVPAFAASTYLSEIPVKQESLTAYEVGFKAPLFNRTLQLNGAAFYYDYKDKQIFVLLQDIIFGGIQQLVNIPKSNVKGGELELIWRPIPGWNISASGTYLETEIKRYTGYNAGGVLADYKGYAFPYAPKWQIAGDTEYDWALTGSLKAFLGGALTYHSKTTAAFGNDKLIAAGKGDYTLNAYVLLDLRAGISSPDDRWRIGVFGRNVTNKYYWNHVEKQQDAVIRYAGRPAWYGVQASYKF
jgi:outer membrane receptor protein involved in Fe transport